MVQTLLIVDDNRVNRRAAIAVCGNLGVPSHEVSSAEEALQVLELQAFAALLLDLRMPGMSGEDLCQRLKADSRFSHMPVVAYTAHVQRSDVETLMRRGFDAVLLKPVRMSEFERVLRSIGLLTG
jgi:CheY-like chemotaxis protein